MPCQQQLKPPPVEFVKNFFCLCVLCVFFSLYLAGFVWIGKVHGTGLLTYLIEVMMIAIRVMIANMPCTVYNCMAYEAYRLSELLSPWC